MTAVFLGACLMSAAGCSHWRPRTERCNPLGGATAEDCLLPFPSSFYTRPDPGSPTGIRVDLRDAALPQSLFGSRMDPAPYNARDGFSPVGALLAYFPERIDASNLPDSEHSEQSLDPKSPVQLIRMDTGERVQIFAELDANANPAKDEQGLIIQPLTRLKPKTRYAVAIQSLHNLKGSPVSPLSGFRRLRDRNPPPAPGSFLEGEQDRFEKIFQVLAHAGIPKRDLQLAWDFTTGSDQETVGRLVKMRDAARAAGAIDRENRAPIHVLKAEANPKDMPELAYRIDATFDSASFLQGGTGDRLKLGANGEPEIDSVARFPLTIHIPFCAIEASQPVPVLIYGHGTFNSAKREMSEEHNRQLINNQTCAIEVGTDWLGRSKSDLASFILKVLPNWDHFPEITDRLQQAHVNMTTLARLIHEGALDRVLKPWLKRRIADPEKIYYYGISEGGCQGPTALALTPEIKRGAMNVPCGFWSMFFWRSSDYYLTRKGLAAFYPGPLERQKLLVVSQLLWDYTDPANYGEHLLKNPLPGNTTKKILYQEGINDASVPNITTRAMARVIGLKLLSPKIEAVPGVEEASGPLDSGYVQYDIGVRPRLGANNIPPAPSHVHEAIRKLPAARAQLQSFFSETGVIRDACGNKPCVFHF